MAEALLVVALWAVALWAVAAELWVVGPQMSVAAAEARAVVVAPEAAPGERTALPHKPRLQDRWSGCGWRRCAGRRGQQHTDPDIAAPPTPVVTYWRADIRAVRGTKSNQFQTFGAGCAES